MAYQCVNPFSGELLQQFHGHTNSQVENALAKADNAPPYRACVS